MPETLERLPVDEPTWFFRTRHVPGAPLAEAATFLHALEDEDLGVFVLAYGLGARLGPVAHALRIEPALVVWRIRRALSRRAAERELDAAMLERAVADLLRGTDARGELPPPPRGAASWHAQDVAAALDGSILARLRARLVVAPGDEHGSRAGVGIGTLGLVLLAVFGFVVFGVIRDVNPLWRGRALVHRGEFDKALAAFHEALQRRVGDPVDAREQIVLCLLAQGHFELAHTELAYPGVAERLGSFAPDPDLPLETYEGDTESRALLPRGRTLGSRPDFHVAGGPAGTLVVTMTWEDGKTQTRTERAPLPDTSGEPFVRIDWPADWRPIPAGTTVTWFVESEGVEHEATFVVADRDERRALGQAFARFLTRDVPVRSREFFRGHHYLNKGYLAKAGQEFAVLRRKFPDRAYPLDQVHRVAEALGLDPSVFLR